MPATLEQFDKLLQHQRSHGDALAKQFAKILFAKATPEFLHDFDPESLMAMALSNFKSFHHKDPDAVQLKVYNPSFQADGWESPYSVIALSVSDRPFIVDSISNALERQGYSQHHMLHPIFRVRRDSQGRMLSIEDYNDDDASYEAFELYFISRIDDLSEQRALETQLHSVLRDVVLATDAYHTMRRQAQQLSESLQGLAQGSQTQGDSQRAAELEEYAAFMRWLDDDNFVFLGYREYDILDQTSDGRSVAHLQVTPGSGIGILSKLEESAYVDPVPLHAISESLRERAIQGKTFIVTKTNAEATVHRAARMDYIGLKKLGEHWQVCGEQRFVGLFTSKAFSTSVETIPILRRKLEQVLKLDQAVSGSHDYKQIVTIFNSMPRSELFWKDHAQLHQDIRTVMGAQQEHGVRLAVRPDPLKRGLAVMVIMPRERFNAKVRSNIQEHLGRKLQASHVDYQLAMGEDETQLRFHFFFTTKLNHYDLDMVALEHEVNELSRSWDDHVSAKLMQQHGESQGRRLQRYLQHFSEGYKAFSSVRAAVRDIEQFEALQQHSQRHVVELINPLDHHAHDEASHLKIYHYGSTLVLSDVLPMLENVGLRVLEQISFFCECSTTESDSPTLLGIDIFRVQDPEGKRLDVRGSGTRISHALSQLLAGQADNDRLNQLVLIAGLSIRQVALLRSYQSYYSQITPSVSRRFISDTLLHHPSIARLLYEAFACKFDPATGLDKAARQERLQQLHSDFQDALNHVASLPEDRTLRGLWNVLEASVRSNFFQDHDSISIKITSAQIDEMPAPRPLYEITVSGSHVEGIHLRGGKVARGGIRWSERPDDYRTEVLGLMKTQMTKNAVIVPVGSKGGFVVKHAPSERDALRSFVEAQYQQYIRALLDVTDNIVGGEAQHPDKLIVYDEADPYLVVAADKGTATFSDVANTIAAEYNFWLGDAFASGGSQGYDHKKEGITARGTWMAANRHFGECGIDPQQEDFRVVGIGDMSGDVFGNGMLYSRHILLVAAFNHQHIFLDPQPDAERSYQERERLFHLPRSSWQDYDQALISQGGGIFSRYAKSIPLSPQVREALAIEAEALSGQDLIQAILCAPVDLLWNGGIGTYVKASRERHSDVGDSSNDTVRVDASALRCRIVGEGGNLGFTQLARVEYALAGGHINTDAIDNSGGVDMSDHEVNIKILLQTALSQGELTMQQRNRLLETMTDEVTALVLHNNYSQSLALSLAQRRSYEDVLLFASLQEYLSDSQQFEGGGLNPQVEYLPNYRGYEERQRNNQGLTRPELAILLAYTKMGIYRRLLSSDLSDDTQFQHYLFEYFPERLRHDFREASLQHPLRREIIATALTNTVVDLLGITFVHRSIRETGADALQVIRSALIAMELLEVPQFLLELRAHEAQVDSENYYQALNELIRALEGVAQWLLFSSRQHNSISSFVERYREPLRSLRDNLAPHLPAGQAQQYQQRQQQYQEAGFSAELAQAIAALDYLPSSMGILDVSHKLNQPQAQVASCFYRIGEHFALNNLRDQLSSQNSLSRWEKIAFSGYVMDLRQAQRKLTHLWLEAEQETLEDWLEPQQVLVNRYQKTRQEVGDNLDLASGGVLSRMLNYLIEALAQSQSH